MADDLNVALEKIQAEFRAFGPNGEDTARLLAAIEAVLELADEWADSAAIEGPDLLVREAISRELTKGESDERA